MGYKLMQLLDNLYVRISCGPVIWLIRGYHHMVKFRHFINVTTKQMVLQCSFPLPTDFSFLGVLKDRNIGSWWILLLLLLNCLPSFQSQTLVKLFKSGHLQPTENFPLICWGSLSHILCLVSGFCARLLEEGRIGWQGIASKCLLVVGTLYMITWLSCSGLSVAQRHPNSSAHALGTFQALLPAHPTLSSSWTCAFCAHAGHLAFQLLHLHSLSFM